MSILLAAALPILRNPFRRRQPIVGYTGRHRGTWTRGYDGPAAHQGATADWSPTGSLRAVDAELPPRELVTGEQDLIAVHDAITSRVTAAIDTFRINTDLILDALCGDDDELRRRVVTSGELTQEWSTAEVRELQQAIEAGHRPLELEAAK